MTVTIGRRELLAALGGAAAAWPLAARAQQAGKVWRIGLLTGVPRETFSGLYAGFQQGMRELGYVEGNDFVSDWRSADGRYERLPDLAAELVRLKVDMLVTGLTPGIRALQQATSTIPIVMAYSTDPIGNGFVASLARPGGMAGDAVFFSQRQQLAELAIINRLPTMFSQREYAVAGGLMSYGENLSDFFRRAASFVDKIIKGAKPGDLPIEQPTKFNLVINRATADALGITIPAQLYIFADVVIEL